MATDRGRLLSLLRRVECFAQLEERPLELLVEQLQPAAFADGEQLCEEGDRGDRMFVIESGEVAVLKAGTQDEPMEVAVLKSGQVAGEMSLFATGERSATLQARGPVRAWVLDHEAFQQLIREHSCLAGGMLTSLTRHLSRSNSIMAKLMSQDLDNRFKVAVFDSKPYVEDVFAARNPFNFRYQFFPVRLSLETVSLAAGFKAVCPFVNDSLDAAVVQELAGMGVELIALRCAGYNNVDIDACERCNIAVTRVPAYSPHAVAEHAVALMLTLNRRVNRAYNRVRDGNFSLSGLVGFDIHGKTVGVVGAGKIGRCLLRIMWGFGCRLLAYDKYPTPDLSENLGVEFVEIDTLLAESDIISLHAPLMPATHHMINAEAIARMKPGVMIINTSRGALIDTAALVEGLKSQRIGYAGLDVYEEESEYFFEDFSDQVMTDDLLARLTTFNNVVITSHQAFLTAEALANITDTTVENIRAFQLGSRGEELVNRVRR